MPEVIEEKETSEFVIGNEYKFLFIEKFALKNGWEMTDHGPELECGKTLLVLEQGFHIMSFLLTDFARQAVYTLVFKQ